jgi:hypothetical protein
MQQRFIAQLAILALIVAGCASVTEYANLKNPVNRTLRASQGQVVLRVDKTKDLPNLWGRADLWGERVATGYDEVRYMGMVDDKMLIFRLHQVTVDSNETTMSRRGIMGPGLAPVGAGLTQLGGTSRVSEQTYEIRHSIAESQVLEHEGIKVTIIQATPSLLTYSLTRGE